MTGTLVLPDGRTLAYEDGGDPDGYPVVGLHGTPGCRYARWPDDDVYRRAGVRFLTTDRPGYGLSSRKPGRSVAHGAADVLALADALGLDRFGVTGGSGGGPHALACAALLGGRVERAACLSGIAPSGSPGLAQEQWTAGMDAGSVDELLWALDGEERLQAELPARQAEMQQADVEDVLGPEAGEADRAYLARPGMAEHSRRNLAEAFRQGVDGWVDDSLAFARPWGFDPRAVGVPLLLLYGLHDHSLPLAHSRWLAEHVPVTHVVVDADGGHLPTDPEREVAEVMGWLARGEAPARAGT